MQDYLKTYGEIIQVYNSFNNHPEFKIENVEKLLKNSTLEFFKEKESNLFTYTIDKKNIDVLEELRNKILMTNANKSNQEKNGDKRKDKDKAQITKEYIDLIDNVNELNKKLNNLIKSGYPDLKNFELQIEDSQAKDKKNEKNLQKMIDEYTEINKNFQKSIKEGYENYPLLRLFYGEQFVKLNESIKESNIINKNVLYLINSVALNKINDINIDFKYKPDVNVFENINSYLTKLFQKNNVNLEEIYKKNQILDTIDLKPDLYRKVKSGDNNTLISNIIDVYLNLTNNLPIINTLLICNEEKNEIDLNEKHLTKKERIEKLIQERLGKLQKKKDKEKNKIIKPNEEKDEDEEDDLSDLNELEKEGEEDEEENDDEEYDSNEEEEENNENEEEEENEEENEENE